MASAELPPPAYSATATTTTSGTSVPLTSSGDAALPAYSFPTSFKIGGRTTDGLLVNIPEIKAHLALLGAFTSLKEQVEASKDLIRDVPLSAERRWPYFVSLAAERFDKWARTLESKDALQNLEDRLPPLDVLMVWHAYMLNPRWYAEDTRRMPVLLPLAELGATFAKEFHRLPELLDSPPTDARVETFYRRVGLPFDPMQAASVATSKDVRCPQCLRTFTIPYMTPSGAGYLQQGFTTTCPSMECKPVTKDSLCARKLAENLSRQGQAPDAFLPGTFFSENPAVHQRASARIIQHVRSAHNFNPGVVHPSGVYEDLCAMILWDADFSLPKLRAKLGQDNLIPRIMSAHATPMIYSVELVGAVIRQGSFVKKMHNLEWTRPGYFDSPIDEVALQHAIARYHAFLDLMSSSPASFFVPTLDIDLIWHTHQLKHNCYAADCQKYVGRFIDHDDKVDGIRLSNSFDMTCKAWKERFGVEYAHCGCPLPGDSIGMRLSRFMSSKSKAAASLPSQLIPPASIPGVLAATHVSEHNAVQFAPRNLRAFQSEIRRHAAHQAKQSKKIEKDKKKQQKKEQEKRDEEYERKYGSREPYGCMYGAAFLFPVPLMVGGAYMYGACVGMHGTAVDHAGACGNGNEMCGGGGCSAGGCGSGGCGGGSSDHSGGGGGGCGGGGCGGGCGGG